MTLVADTVADFSEASSSAHPGTSAAPAAWMVVGIGDAAVVEPERNHLEVLVSTRWSGPFRPRVHATCRRGASRRRQPQRSCRDGCGASTRAPLARAAGGLSDRRLRPDGLGADRARRAASRASGRRQPHAIARTARHRRDGRRHGEAASGAHPRRLAARRRVVGDGHHRRGGCRVANKRRPAKALPW